MDCKNWLIFLKQWKVEYVINGSPEARQVHTLENDPHNSSNDDQMSNQCIT